MNGNLAQQQGRYFYDELPVNNTAQPQFPQVAVTAETAAISITSEQGHVYLPATPEHYTYDQDGNLIQDGRWNYSGDAENRLIAMESISLALAAARKKMTFVYDYMGRRVLKYTHDWDTSSNDWSTGFMHKYYYDGWNLIGEVDETGLVKSYLWGTDLSGTAQGAGGVGGLLKIEDWYTPAPAIPPAMNPTPSPTPTVTS